MNRREMLSACAASFAAPILGSSTSKPPRMGIVEFVYSNRLAADRVSGKPGLTDPIAFLQHCRERGAGGIQFGLGIRELDYTSALRAAAEAAGMYIEGVVRMPRGAGERERFRSEVQTAKNAGASIVRTVLFRGRRYETFDSLAAFNRAAEQAWQALTRVEPIVARENMRLAVENHKNYRCQELAALLKQLGSRHVGVCLDTGNNLALLEDTLEVVKTLAPLAFTVHFKDMAVAEYSDGFRLAEVALGEGISDLKQMVAILRRAHPAIHINLEMITRDPLRVPCLTPKYWASFPDLPGRDLARTLRLVRSHPAKKLETISELPRDRKIAVEEANVTRSFAYARKNLDL